MANKQKQNVGYPKPALDIKGALKDKCPGWQGQPLPNLQPGFKPQTNNKAKHKKRRCN